MARWKPAPVIGGAYSDDAKAWSDQDTVNWIPVVAERGGTRTPTMLRDAPGLIVISDLGTNAPIRGTHNVEGLLLAVSGNKLFKIGVDGAGTEIGTIPGVERVSMAHNQITGGNEVAIANGQSGYVYNTVTGTLTQITDDGFPGAISFDFCDGYIMGIEPGRRFGFHSQLAAAGDYNTLDRYEAEGSPDKLVGQIVTHREWWLFGERTIEPYVNTGAATGTFQRSSGTVIEIGAASRHAICQMDNSVFWLGDDVVYRANGYTPVRISTHAIEQAIARCNTAQAFAFTFEDRGHKIFYLTFPDGQTWGYDAASGEWHRRQSYGLDRWRINTLTKWRGAWVAGDYTNGRLYQLDWNTSNEAGEVLERRRITGVLSDSQNPVTVNGVALVFDTGVSSGDGKLATNNPLIKPLSISGDLPDGATGAPVDFTYTISGGVKPYGSLTVTSGALPTGLTMDSAGRVTGSVSAGGPYAWTVAGTDAVGTTDSLDDAASFYVPATFDPATATSTAALSNGNRDITMVDNAIQAARANTLKTTGKWYVEYQIISAPGYDNVAIWVQDAGNPPLSSSTGGAGLLAWHSDGSFFLNGSYSGAGLPGFSTGAVLGVAFDTATRQVWLRNAAGWALADPGSPSTLVLSAVTANFDTGAWMNYITSVTQHVRINTGQEAFAYPVPAGFLPLSTP